MEEESRFYFKAVCFSNLFEFSERVSLNMDKGDQNFQKTFSMSLKGSPVKTVKEANQARKPVHC